MTEDEQSVLRSKIEETKKEMLAISYRRQQLAEEYMQLDLIYMGLFKFKDGLERKLIKPKIVRTRGPKPIVQLTPLDEAQAALSKMTAEQIRSLLAELQGSEEEGKEIEFEDEPETNIVDQDDGRSEEY